MTQQYLFARAYALALGPPSGGAGLQFGNLATASAALRLSFEVQKGIKDKPNKAKVVLYNLSQTTRTALTVGYQLLLRAGYQGLVDKVFIGTVDKVSHERSGPDITTTLEATDGQQGLLNASFTQAYPPSTPLATIISDIGQAMSLDPGVVLGLPDETLARGASFAGSARTALQTLCRPRALEFSVQNGRLNILPLGKHLGTAAVVIGQTSGLLGVPSIVKDGVQFDALLNPRLTPGQLVQVVSKNAAAAGYYVVRQAKLEGDTHDQKWSVSCICAKVMQPVQTLAAAHGFNYAQAVIPGLI